MTRSAKGLRPGVLKRIAGKGFVGIWTILIMYIGVGKVKIGFRL
jgi:hypothetical protein